MNTLKKTIASTKKFVSNHRVAFAVVVTAAICGQAARRGQAINDAFLKEHGLYEEFHNPTTEG